MKQAREHNSSRAYFFAGGTILCWATVATAFKWALADTTPAGLLWVATLTSFLALGIGWMVRSGGKNIFQTLHSLSAGTWAKAALLGFVNPFLYYLILFKAYSLLPAQVAQSLNVIWPVLLVLLSIPILGQRIGWLSIVGMVISFAGALVIATQGDFSSLLQGKLQNPLGVILAASSAILWAVYFLLNMKSKLPPLPGLWMNFLFASLYILVYMGIRGSYSLLVAMSVKTWLCGVYVGLFEMAIPFILWLNALRLAKNTAVVSSLIYLFPFLSLILIHFVLGEPIYATTLIGLVLIIAGVLLAKSKE